MQGSRILLIDHDPRTRELLVPLLEKHGLTVLTLETGERAVEVLSGSAVILVILGNELPGDSGLTVCRRLRESGWQLPVIMTSAHDEVVDRILGLETGADDYLVKPIDPRELLARIRAQIRRQVRSDDGNGSGRSPGACRFGPFELDSGRRSLTKAGQPLALTRVEFAILDALTRYPNEALPRERIYKLIHHRKLISSARCIDIQIARLRRVLEEDAGSPCYIRTVWGVGYAFFPEGTRALTPAPGYPSAGELSQ
jgi:two-component system, OmpR family, phosphate regulon response regulator OmpR